MVILYNKRKEADRFGKTDRTIQSDIDTIQNFLIDRVSDGEPEREVLYDRKSNGGKRAFVHGNIIYKDER